MFHLLNVVTCTSRLTFSADIIHVYTYTYVFTYIVAYFCMYILVVNI